MSGPAEKPAPAPVTAQERWVCEHRVCAIRVEYRQTGTDTAETFLHLTATYGATVCWCEATFRKVARLEIGTSSIASPAYGVADRVKARTEWEQKNARELADYKRLKEKYG